MINNNNTDLSTIEAEISLKMLNDIKTVDAKSLGSAIANYGDFQAACYRRAYIAQIGKLPASPSQP